MGKLGGAPFYKKVKSNHFPYSWNTLTLNAGSLYTAKYYNSDLSERINYLVSWCNLLF